MQMRRFTTDEDAALRAGFERISPQAGDEERRALCRRLGTKLSRRAHVIQQRAKLLGYWEADGTDPPIPTVSHNGFDQTVSGSTAGGFTSEEDAIIWEAYSQHRTVAASSAAAAAGSRDGVLGYVSELAELLGRSYTQVQRRLDRLRAQDQATPR
jgi:hypothetical protein